MATITVTRDNWLLEAGKLSAGDRLYMNPRGDLTQAMALEALEAQYGLGEFDTWDHGQSLRIMRGRWNMPFADANGGMLVRYHESMRAYRKGEADGVPSEQLEELRARANKASDAWKRAAPKAPTQ